MLTPWASTYDLQSPATLAEALQRMASQPGKWKPFAGGTDLMVLLESGKLRHQNFLSIWKLPELHGIEVTFTHVTLGALTTYSEVAQSLIGARIFAQLSLAASETGSIATQNRGTIGGNIANASPAADFPPALLVYDAELELVSAVGTRWLPCTQFWRSYKNIDLRDDELVAPFVFRAKIFLGSTSTARWYRHAQAISKVCFAAAALLQSRRVADVRIALGSVAPTVLRAVKTENVLRGQSPSTEIVRAAQETLAQEIAPIDDIRSTARYRLRIAQNLLAQFCESLVP